MGKINQIALVGNPNVGKTTLFNQLTGLSQKTGNWPGVTIDKITGKMKIGENTADVIDLPGLYSLEYGEIEEEIVINELKSSNYDCVINIVDATQMERNLMLTSQLVQLNLPVIIALNFFDLAEKRGNIVDTESLSRLFGAPVVIINPRTSNGVQPIFDFLSTQEIKNAQPTVTFPNNDEQRIPFIEENIIPAVINNTCESTPQTLTNKIDKYVLNRWLSFPILWFVLFLLFAVTFQYVGQPITDFLDGLINDSLVPYLESLPLLQESSMLSSLVIEGIIGGVGTIVAALPLILTLFLGMSIIEDSGYMARISVILDRLLRKIGLSGRAIIPLISGFGCAVPGVMATKGLQSDAERKITIMLLPFMSCSARAPIYALFAVIFFPEHAVIATFGLYIFGVIVAIIVGLLLKIFVYKEAPAPFIIELPEYRIPAFASIIKHTYEKGMAFIKKAATIILAGVILIWAVSHFNFQFQYTEEMNESMLAIIAGWLSPIFAPLGFGNWQNVVGIISGFLAKETVVSTFGVVYGGGADSDPSSMLAASFTLRSAISFLIFTLLYTPCVSVIAAVAKEYGRKWATIIALYPVGVAWIFSFIIYQLLGLFGVM